MTLDFVERIKRIEAWILDPRAPRKLLEYPEFREIHEHPGRYTAEIVDILESPESTDRQKKIVVLSVQSLEMPWFLLFAQHMLQFLESGTISRGVFELAVFPPYDWNAKLIESYEERDVAKFLRPVLEPGRSRHAGRKPSARRY